MNEPDLDPILEIRYAMRRQHDDARRLRAMLLEQVEGGMKQSVLARSVGLKERTLSTWLDLARRERRDPENAVERLPYTPKH